MGPRYLRFLDAVDRTGTIRAAGREVGWSYRTCLNRIREMERVLGAKVLATSRGGPSGGGSAKLTVEARRLVKLFAHWRREALRSEEHTSELQSLAYLVCRLLLEKKKKKGS